MGHHGPGDRAVADGHAGHELVLGRPAHDGATGVQVIEIVLQVHGCSSSMNPPWTWIATRCCGCLTKTGGACSWVPMTRWPRCRPSRRPMCAPRGSSCPTAPAPAASWRPGWAWMPRRGRASPSCPWSRLARRGCARGRDCPGAGYSLRASPPRVWRTTSKRSSFASSSGAMPAFCLAMAI